MSTPRPQRGYIIRTSLPNRYEIYRPEVASGLHVGNVWGDPSLAEEHFDDCGHYRWNRYRNRVGFAASRSEYRVGEKMEHRPIELREGFGMDFGDEEGKGGKGAGMGYENAQPGTPKQAKKLVDGVRDDPVREGMEMAVEGVEASMGGHTVGGNHGAVRLLLDTEEKELQELRRCGILYDEADDLRLDDIVREEPVCTIRRATRRKGRAKWMRASGGRVEQRMDDALVTPGFAVSWANLAEQRGFELVMPDDLASIADSWVDLDAEVGM